MVSDSGYVYKQGDPIQVGEHGVHSNLYHSGEAVVDNGASAFIFEAGTGLGRNYTWVDSFEDGSMSEYDDGPFTPVQDSSVATDRDWYLKSESNNNNITSNSGLNYYPQRGDIIESDTWILGRGNGAETCFFTDGPGSNDPSYGIHIAITPDDTGVLALIKDSGGGDTFNETGTTKVQQDVDPSEIEQTWVRCRVEIDNPTMTAKFYNGSDFQNQISEVSVDDGDYTSGGISFDTSPSNTDNDGLEQRWDNFRKVGTV